MDVEEIEAAEEAEEDVKTVSGIIKKLVPLPSFWERVPKHSVLVKISSNVTAKKDEI